MSDVVACLEKSDLEMEHEAAMAVAVAVDDSKNMGRCAGGWEGGVCVCVCVCVCVR